MVFKFPQRLYTCHRSFYVETCIHVCVAAITVFVFAKFRWHSCRFRPITAVIRSSFFTVQGQPGVIQEGKRKISTYKLCCQVERLGCEVFYNSELLQLHTRRLLLDQNHTPSKGSYWAEFRFCNTYCPQAPARLLPLDEGSVWVFRRPWQKLTSNKSSYPSSVLCTRITSLNFNYKASIWVLFSSFWGFFSPNLCNRDTGKVEGRGQCIAVPANSNPPETPGSTTA